MTKPVASRSTSAEIYVIGSRYKAPAKIDPRLLDVKHLFQGPIEPPKVRRCMFSVINIIMFQQSSKAFDHSALVFNDVGCRCS